MMPGEDRCSAKGFAVRRFPRDGEYVRIAWLILLSAGILETRWSIGLCSEPACYGNHVMAEPESRSICTKMLSCIPLKLTHSGAAYSAT